MIKSLTIVLLFSTIIFSQPKMNPDGYIGGFSLHFTPYLSYGDSKYEFANKEVGKYENKGDFNFKIEAAIPFNEFATVKLFYSREENYTGYYLKEHSNYIEPDFKIDGSHNILGATISLYFGGKN